MLLLCLCSDRRNTNTKTKVTGSKLLALRSSMWSPCAGSYEMWRVVKPHGSTAKRVQATRYTKGASSGLLVIKGPALMQGIRTWFSIRLRANRASTNWWRCILGGVGMLEECPVVNIEFLDELHPELQRHLSSVRERAGLKVCAMGRLAKRAGIIEPIVCGADGVGHD